MRSEAQIVKDRLRRIMFNNGTIEEMRDYMESRKEALYDHEIKQLEIYFQLNDTGK